MSDLEFRTVDNAGNRTAKTDQRAALTSNYGYDAIYQLLSTTQSGSTTESYTYDPVGSRTASLGVSSYSNNSSNELTSSSNASYTYDANGNTTSKTDSTGTTNYTWDFENRLTQVTLPGTGGTVNLKYDPFGRRIYKSSSSSTSIFAYKGDNLIEETDASGVAAARYTQTENIDEPLAMLRVSGTSYYNTDGLGSVTSLTNAAAALTQTYTFDSFGKLTASSGSVINSFRYTARESDVETDLYSYRARYYDPTIGRFLSEDPIRFDGGIDSYTYALNEPVSFSDPTGLSPTGNCIKACVKIYYGLSRDAGFVLGISAPIIPKAFTLGGGTGATSIASPILRKLWPTFVPGGILAPTIGNLASRTPIAGAALARWLPVAGLALTAIDIYGIQDCTRQCLRDNWFPCTDK